MCGCYMKCNAWLKWVKYYVRYFAKVRYVTKLWNYHPFMARCAWFSYENSMSKLSLQHNDNAKYVRIPKPTNLLLTLFLENYAVKKDSRR